MAKKNHWDALAKEFPNGIVKGSKSKALSKAKK